MLCTFELSISQDFGTSQRIWLQKNTAFIFYYVEMLRDMFSCGPKHVQAQAQEPLAAAVEQWVRALALQAFLGDLSHKNSYM